MRRTFGVLFSGLLLVVFVLLVFPSVSAESVFDYKIAHCKPSTTNYERGEFDCSDERFVIDVTEELGKFDGVLKALSDAAPAQIVVTNFEENFEEIQVKGKLQRFYGNEGQSCLLVKADRDGDRTYEELVFEKCFEQMDREQVYDVSFETDSSDSLMFYSIGRNEGWGVVQVDYIGLKNRDCVEVVCDEGAVCVEGICVRSPEDPFNLGVNYYPSVDGFKGGYYSIRVGNKRDYVVKDKDLQLVIEGEGYGVVTLQNFGEGFINPHDRKRYKIVYRDHEGACGDEFTWTLKDIRNGVVLERKSGVLNCLEVERSGSPNLEMEYVVQEISDAYFLFLNPEYNERIDLSEIYITAGFHSPTSHKSRSNNPDNRYPEEFRFNEKLGMFEIIGVVADRFYNDFDVIEIRLDYLQEKTEWSIPLDYIVVERRTENTPREKGYSFAYWECYDGKKGSHKDAESELRISCQSAEYWKKFAVGFCEGHCSEESGKCGINSFSLSGECGSDVRSGAIIESLCAQKNSDICKSKNVKDGTAVNSCDKCNKCTCEGGKVSCTEKACPSNEVEITSCLNSCPANGKCYPFGYRIKADYCSDDGKFVEQLSSSKLCSNSHECGSNLCIDDKCVERGVFNKLISWFKGLFG